MPESPTTDTGGIKDVNAEDNLRMRLARLDTRLRNEFDLVSSRTGWLLATHGLLLAAFGTSLGLEKGQSAATAEMSMRSLLLVLLPILGLASSLIVSWSIRAAYSVIERIKSMRTLVLNEMHQRFRYEQTDSLPSEVFAGDLPPKILPILLALVWGVLLLGIFRLAGGVGD